MKVLQGFFLFSVLLAGTVAKAQPASEAELNRVVDKTLQSFPVPPARSSLLFYLQRNKNSNTVVYEANILPDGKLDPEKPVKVYWIRYDEGNVIRELNWIQRWLAYGIEFEKAKDGSGDYLITPVALKNRQLTVTVGKNGQAAAYIKLNGQRARLTRIYAEASETSWLPTVKYVQLKGISVDTGKELFEYIYPRNR